MQNYLFSLIIIIIIIIVHSYVIIRFVLFGTAAEGDTAKTANGLCDGLAVYDPGDFGDAVRCGTTPSAAGSGRTTTKIADSPRELKAYLCNVPRATCVCI